MPDASAPHYEPIDDDSGPRHSVVVSPRLVTAMTVAAVIAIYAAVFGGALAAGGW